MARTQTVSIALTPQEKERWKAAQECTPFENLAAFVRYSMESVTDMVLSVGSTEELEVIETTEDIVCKKEEKLRLFKDMQKLDNLSREVVYLRTIGNLNFIEIGEILGKTANWARVTFYRAKQKIREVNKNGKENRM